MIAILSEVRCWRNGVFTLNDSPPRRACVRVSGEVVCMWLMMAPTQQASITHWVTVRLLAARLAAPPALANCSDAGDNRLQTTTQMKPPETENHAGCERGLFRVGGEVEEGVKKKKRKEKMPVQVDAIGGYRK